MTERRIIPLTPRPATTSAVTARPQLTHPPPLALYVHYPWCVRKCPYCDFNSHAISRADVHSQVGVHSRVGVNSQVGVNSPMQHDDAVRDTAYVDALIADLETALPQVWGRRVQSVFIGGGTPSLMSAAALDRLLTAIRMLLPLDPLAEITLEANPGTTESSRFRDYRAAGVNRLSIGVQSFHDAQLTRLGRIHDGHCARAAIDTALAHFERVNVDLMYALPEQSLVQALDDIDTALGFGIRHLSCYQLTLEPNTPFHHTPPPLPDSDAAADMQDAIEQRLAAAGFDHYETSAFAQRGQQCRHNLNYWQFGDYLGIGAGAHGKLSSHAGIVREMRHKHPERYLEAAKTRDFVQERREVGAGELAFEFMMNALRLTDGVARDLFTARTGLPLTSIEAELIEARRKGLLEIDPTHLRPTEHGRRFLNDLLTLFLTER